MHVKWRVELFSLLTGWRNSRCLLILRILSSHIKLCSMYKTIQHLLKDYMHQKPKCCTDQRLAHVCKTPVSPLSATSKCVHDLYFICRLYINCNLAIVKFYRKMGMEIIAEVCMNQELRIMLNSIVLFGHLFCFISVPLKPKRKIKLNSNGLESSNAREIYLSQWICLLIHLGLFSLFSWEGKSWLQLLIRFSIDCTFHFSFTTLPIIRVGKQILTNMTPHGYWC